MNRPLISLLASAWLLVSSGTQADKPEGLDDYVNELMAISQVPGVAISVVSGDEVVLAQGYGVREAGKHDPVEPALSVHFTSQRVSAKPKVHENGTGETSALIVPESAFLSGETRRALKKQRDVYMSEFRDMNENCERRADGISFSQEERFQCRRDAYYQTTFYKNLRKRYDVKLSSDTIGGVYVEIFEPAGGVAPGHRDKLLINLHGGGFQAGSRTGSHGESIPIAAIGGFKVVSIDYRMAPQFTFPAASEDVASVYRELIKEYDPEKIGIYGCSAGGILTAQSVAWFAAHDLPRPGAIGIFCAGAPTAKHPGKDNWVNSDSAYFAQSLTGTDYEKTYGNGHPYYKGVDRRNPLASPGSYDEVMAAFPPTLILTGVRDFLLSGAVYTHGQLTRLGVETDLHVWEGMKHGFQFNPEVPEAQEAYRVTVNFFDRHLARPN